MSIPDSSIEARNLPPDTTLSPGDKFVIGIASEDGKVKLVDYSNLKMVIDNSGDNVLQTALQYINNAIASIDTGLDTPVTLDLESNLPANIELQNYYIIQNMDISSPNHQGKAWWNNNQWYKIVDNIGTPDGTTIIINPNNNVYKNQKASSEDIALGETIVEETTKRNEIIVFDRGVQKRETYSQLIDKDISFVSRLKINAKYEIVKIHKEIKGRKAGELLLESDEIVKLYGKNGKRLDKEIRVIVAKKGTEKYIFVTNILELSAVKITEIYARRWDIEVFFKFIKQEFGFSHFVSRSENGIKNMLYMTLIASILMIVYKEKNKIEGYKEARRMFVAELNELLLIELTIATGGDVHILKRDYLVYYSDY